MKAYASLLKVDSLDLLYRAAVVGMVVVPAVALGTVFYAANELPQIEREINQLPLEEKIALLDDLKASLKCDDWPRAMELPRTEPDRALAREALASGRCQLKSGPVISQLPHCFPYCPRDYDPWGENPRGNYNWLRAASPN